MFRLHKYTYWPKQKTPYVKIITKQRVGIYQPYVIQIAYRPRSRSPLPKVSVVALLEKDCCWN